MFIRIKKINKQEYAYLVENKWRKNRKNKVRQKTLKYLGRVHKLEKGAKKETVTLDEYNKLDPEKIILELIKLELLNHDFKQLSRFIFERNTFHVNLVNKKVTDKKTKKEICLEINNNFLCSYTLRKLLNFSPKQGLTKLQIGKQLANSLESAGIIVPKEIFVIVAQKILKNVEE